ncbi:MAG: WD40 repeat domain-containing protein [Planctomycetota bacterium]|nr:WD40 repeat domain-containing protein [Planctomycetota bacterium]
MSSAAGNSLKLWNLSPEQEEAATGRELRTFSGHTYYVSGIAFSPNGELALSGSYDKTVKLWDVATGRELRTFSGHAEAVTSVGFSPDGKMALSGSIDMTLKLWEVATGRELRTFRGHTGAVCSVAFSPDEQHILSAGRDNMQFRDFTRPARYREFDARLPKARKAIQKNENDAEALKTFGEWYAFRGVNDWAVEFLEKARKNGAEVSPLTLARCYWLLSEDEREPMDKRPAHRAAAVAEYQKEIARAKAQPVPQEAKAKLAREQEEFYLDLCLQAVSKPAPADKPADPK